MNTKTKNAGADEVLAKISKFSDKYRSIAKKLHMLITETAPNVQPRLWYGMPGYALKEDGPVVLFFREDKYVSFGLTESAPVTVEGLTESAWFFTELDEKTEKKIVTIVRKVAC